MVHCNCEHLEGANAIMANDACRAMKCMLAGVRLGYKAHGGARFTAESEHTSPVVVCCDIALGGSVQSY